MLCVLLIQMEYRKSSHTHYLIRAAVTLQHVWPHQTNVVVTMKFFIFTKVKMKNYIFTKVRMKNFIVTHFHSFSLK